MMAAERVSALVVREQLLRCFAQEHAERFAVQERALGIRAGMRNGLEMMVRLAFQQVGGDFDNPSRESLAQVANLLAERSLEWGAPEDMVFECHSHVLQQISYVDEASSASPYGSTSVSETLAN